MEFWKRKLKLGMVGGGRGAFIGEVHRWAAALDGQYELKAGCFSRDYENTLATGKKLYLDQSRCYRTYREMFESEQKLPPGDRIDCAAIVTPNNSHFPIAKEALLHGFHVICDKPMTFNLEEAEQLAALVEKSGLVFGLTHNYTGNPMIKEARALIQKGELGEIRKVIVEYLQEFLSYPFEKEGNKQAMWRVDPKQAGLGGTLGDCGSHAFNLLEYLIGNQVESLCADTSTFMPGRILDEDVNVLLRLKNKAKGVLTVSQIAVGHENDLRIRIYGSRGSLSWEQENPNILKVAVFSEPVKIYTRGNGYLTKPAADVRRVPSGHPEGYLEAFANIYLAFGTALRAYADGKPLKISDYDFPSVFDGVRGMKFISGAVESAKNNASWIKI